MFFLTFSLTLDNFWQTLKGSFSAVSKPNFASKYSFESSWRDLQDLHAFAPLESNRRTMKSASGKRPPDEAHGAPEKKLSSRSTAPYSKSHLNFVKQFYIFAGLLRDWETYGWKGKETCYLDTYASKNIFIFQSQRLISFSTFTHVFYFFLEKRRFW